MKEIIERYEPDLLYSDSNLPFGEVTDAPLGDYRYGLEAVAALYNQSEKLHGKNQAVYTQKNRDESIYRVGVLDIERSQLPDISPVPWQSETCIGGWFYDTRAVYKHPRHIIDILIDSIAKNGTMLLNILQRPDGTIDEEAEFILQKLGEWFAVCSEAVYGTRPWRVFGEGDTLVKIEGFREDKTDWKRNDFRFVQKGGAVYAFMMGIKGGETAVLRSFAEQEVHSVELLGYGPVPFRKEFGVLTVSLPDHLPALCANALKIR